MNADSSLLGILLSAARDFPDQVLITVDGDGGERCRTHRGLLEESLQVAGGLQAVSLPVGTPVLLPAGADADFLPSFWGALAAGLIPVPLAPVPDRVHAVWTHLQRPPVVVGETLEPLMRAAAASRSMRELRLLDIGSLRAAGRTAVVHEPAPDDVAFLQFSSGSTAAPKGVELTHANLLANIAQTRAAGAATASDVIVTWLPYFHDMGLIGAHLTPLAVGIKQVTLSPLDFAKRPALWYQTAERHRATLLPMASFALEVTLKRVTSEQVASLDLSSVRLVGVGSEPIPARTWQRFLTHMRPAKLDPRALVPLYGLAEATLSVAFPPLGELARPIALDRGALAERRAVDSARRPEDPARGGGRGPTPAEFMDLGFAVPGGELRIVGNRGEVVADSVVGHIEFRGPNVARGYHGRPEETAHSFVDGWLRTGDLGFLRSGRLCVTGRAKDVLFINGQTFHAHDIEQVVATTPGAPTGRVAVVGYTDPDSGAERVAVFLSSGRIQVSELAELLTAVRARVREALSYADVRVLPIAAEDFPRTTSGKVRRGRLRELLAAGSFASLEDEVARVCADAAAFSACPSRPKQRSTRDVESVIIDIWAQVLEVPADTIGRNDRFLAIGGSSLAAMQVLGALEEAFGGPLNPSVLRECATVAALADHFLGHVAAPRDADLTSSALSEGGPAAVIALACRLPDADTPEAFWDNLLSGRDSVTEVPHSRWVTRSGARARWGAFLDDVAGFDADFFGVEAREAAAMDPHARIFLEVAHEALERAGYAGERRRNRRIGVFVAVGESGYPELLRHAMDNGLPPSPAALVGNLRSLVAARVAQHLDLSGPAMVVDTACSSSLVALHLARRSLDSGECDVAVVGGVHLNLTATTYQLLEAAQALSPTGRCRAFSAGADGFVPGEGAAAIVLAPLASARSAGDDVLAVVRGSAVNNDGRSLSLMAPNPLLQEAVIAAAYRDAHIDPGTVSYVEAHGTGTAIGDPIEARSLMRTFPRAAVPRWLGSVKTNVGHLLNTAGMPSLLKVVLSLHHRRLPPSLHYAEPSPEFDLSSAGFAVVSEPRVWSGPGPLRAGINGFGFGGTNAHVILEEAPADRRPVASPPPGPHLLTLSAASDVALRAVATDLAAYVRSHPDLDEGDVCRTASTARDDARHRLAVVAQGDLAPQLDAVVASRGPVGVAARRRPRVALLFPGQGAQVPGMGVGPHSCLPAYRDMIEELSAAVGTIGRQSLLEWSLDADASPAELAQTAVAQPLLVAFEISLLHSLRAWGIRADAVLGHSVGELAAAAACGAMSSADAVGFAVQRGKAMQDCCAPGAMAAVRGAEADVVSVIDSAGGALSLAAANAPAQFVISGTVSAVDAALAALAERGCHGRRLSVSHAFHSAMMDPALALMRAAAQRITFNPAQTPLLSSVTGEWTPTFDATYLAEHARHPVRFGPAVQRLLDDGYDTFVEVGPGSTLTGLVTSIAKGGDRSGPLSVFPVLNGAAEAGSALVGTVGRLWTAGVSLSRPDSSLSRPRVDVPTYPFQRTRHWLPQVQTLSSAPQSSTSGSDADPVSSLLHRFGWEELPLPAGSVLQSVCITGGDDDLAGVLADRLARRAVTVHVAALEELRDSPPASVLVLLAGRAVDLDGAASLDRSAGEATAAMLQVCRHLHERTTPLIVVTEDVAVTGTVSERARPAQAIAAGLAMALPEENPQQPVRVVDLSSLDHASDRLDAVIRELDAPPQAAHAEMVAWRRGRRLTKAAVKGEVLRRERPAPLPADGRYLITGGAGGVGAAVAGFLALRGHPEIFLVGRSPECQPGLLQELRELGATPRYVAADLSVAGDVDRLVGSLPLLNGVFHAAGLARAGALRSMEVSAVEEVLAPKVRGTFLLARALDRVGRRPDAFVAISSLSSAVAGYAGGLGAYAAANAFLDGFAVAETAAGRPMQALNFAAWADTGMASSALFASAARSGGVPHLSPEHALQAMYDATTVDIPQLLVMHTDCSQPPLVEADSDSRPPARPAARKQSTIGSSSAVRDVIAALIAPEIGQSPGEIDDDASFLAMGLDSLTAVDLVKKLEAALDRALPTTLLFEHPSIAQLAAYVSADPAAGTPEQTDAAGDGDRSFGLTPVQVAFHTMGQLHPQLSAYAAVRLTVVGRLHDELLARSLAFLERRHPMLRMRLRFHSGQPCQMVEPPTQPAWPEWFDVTDLDRPIEEVEDALCNRVFDLATEPPIRVACLREGPERAYLVIVLHHAAADGASLNLLCEELWQVYTALSQGRAPELPPLSSSFRDYVRLTEQQRASETFAVDSAYWRHRLHQASAAPQGSLPHDGDPSPNPARPLRARQLRVSADVTEALRERAADLDVSLFHLVLSAYVRRLASWSDQAEITVNVARNGREMRLQDINGLVGPFADTLPLTVAAPLDDEMPSLAHSVKDAWLDSMRHASVTTLDLAGELPALDAAPRTAGEAGFSFARFPLHAPSGCPVRVTATAARTASAATRLGLVCWEFEGALQFSWNYPARLFSSASLERFTDELLAELTSLANRAPQTTQAPGIAHRIHAQCRRTPDAVAVQAGDDATTYAQLDGAARRLAQRLHRHGIKPNDRVALLTAPGAGTVVGVLAILYAGAAWVPLDSRHPAQRLADQATRAEASAVVCQGSTRRLAQRLAAGDVIDLDDTALSEPEADPTAVGGRAEDDAYVMFTSGTTGRPKGIPITHGAVTTYLDWAISAFGYHAGDRMAATASLCFDASVRQMLAPLLVGATIVAISRDSLRDPQALLGEVEQRQVTVWSSVPTLWGELLRAAERRTEATGAPPDLAALRWIHVGGEPLSPGHVRRWFDLFGARHRVVNLYGPTEATINATYEVIDSRPDDDVTRIAIGRPVAETVIDVEDATGGSCSPGEAGELLLAGPGVTTGYLAEPGLSADVFVEKAGRRYYRTGDRVVRRVDGTLEFLGRVDRLVNIRGHRVEPEEIEVVLGGHPGVERAAVAIEPVPGRAPRLVAYIQPRRFDGSGPTGDVLRDLSEHLADHLPDYMRPAQIRLTDSMPLTPTGKVDLTQLPIFAARRNATTPERVGAPVVTPTERLLADVWCDILGTDRVFRHDDFFSLGGDSIGVLEVFARLERLVPWLPAPTALYQHRMLCDLATAIDASTPAPTGEPVHDEDHDVDHASPFPLTPAQRGFLLAEAMSSNARSSWVHCFHIAGPLDTELFQQAFDRLVARHLMLRVIIDAAQRPPLQREMPRSSTITISTEAVSREQLARIVSEERNHRFDLSGWPLARLRLLELAPEKFAFLVNGHHVIADGFSVVLMGQELMTIYDGLVAGQPTELPQLRSTFRDYVRLVSKKPAVSSASPVDGERSLRDSYSAPRLRSAGNDPRALAVAPLKATFTLDTRTAAMLNGVAIAEGTTPYAPLLTAYYRALTRLTGQEDIALAVATTGRDYVLPDITRIVGPCAHLLPLRVSDRSNDFGSQLRALSRAVTEARTNAAAMQDRAGRPSTADLGASGFDAQFVFSYLDFRSLGHISGRTLSFTWDQDGADMEPPPVGTDLFLSARPDDDGLHVTVRASAAAMTTTRLAGFVDEIRGDLLQLAGSPPRRANAATKRQPLDAAIVGYLPTPRDFATFTGIAPAHGFREQRFREQVRGRLFPDGRARLLEELATPLGNSGFVCLPVFADELTTRGSDTLANDTAQAVAYARHLGARCVSLAGMIPAHTAYGFGVVRLMDAAATRITTGHAATAASVVRTSMAAMKQTHRDLSQTSVAFVGLGSIGRSSLELLLAQGGSSKSLVLCDVASRRHHLSALARDIAASGYCGRVTIACSDPSLPEEVYDADLIVAAISGSSRSIVVDRLRPGTIVVDDSFPHCFDTSAARRRMARQGDVLMIGGGLLTCEPLERTPVNGVVTDAQLAHLTSLRPPNTIASCQLESLVQASRPDLPVVHGVVDHALARAYWDALTAAGVTAAPLHLLEQVLTTEYLRAFSAVGR